MMVLVVASQKGGVGKTTLTGHLGVEAEHAGAGPVALLDTDPQGSLSEWWNERKVEMPAFAFAALDRLPVQLAELAAAGVKVCIIDTPPALNETIKVVLKVAHLVLIPTRPSPHDLRAIGATVELVHAAGKRMVFVVNGATPRARITADAAIALSQHGTVAPTILYQRIDFAASMIDGRTAGELNASSKSGMEIAELWKYVDTQLRRYETS